NCDLNYLRRYVIFYQSIGQVICHSQNPKERTHLQRTASLTLPRITHAGHEESPQKKRSLNCKNPVFLFPLSRISVIEGRTEFPVEKWRHWTVPFALAREIGNPHAKASRFYRDLSLESHAAGR